MLVACAAKENSPDRSNVKHQKFIYLH